MSKFLIVSNRDIKNAQYFENPEALEDYLEGFGLIRGIDSILFAFWSWKVPDEMLKKYKCYGLHTGFLLDGKGKGGSPIDNLQKLGIVWAALNVFEMNDVIDGGRVRLAIPMNIDMPKQIIIESIDNGMPIIVEFLKQDISMVPERFQRLPNVK